MTVDVQQETLSFQTEVKQLLHLMVHALYSNKEIFLRELISNSSDALDKLRFEALSDGALFEDDSELQVVVDFDKDNKTLTIRDNGIGMSRDEIIVNLGTIAKSGTKEFIKNLTGEQSKDSNLIGQFGVGFYSAFIVADEVIVKSRRAGTSADEGIAWRSKGEGEYTLEPIDKASRGTEVILHLKEDASEFLDAWRLRNVITTYSDHISFPVLMPKQPELDKDGKEIISDKVELEAVNKATALWTRSKNDITADEYKEFYKHISHDFQEPLLWTHNRVEGKYEYTSLMYIPSQAPFDLWNREKRYGVKLYVQRVFIMDDAEQFLPSYLRFVRGIIDCNDLPLNISREILQNNRVVESIRSATVKKILTSLESLSNDEEKYPEFWKQFGEVLKEGPAEDMGNKETIAQLMRFSSTHDEKMDQDVSFKAYVERMKEGQEKIYYITAESFAAAKSSPQLEIFRQQGIEVLLLSDRVDEWLVSHLTEFDGKTLQSIAKGEVDLGEIAGEEAKAAQEEADKNYKALVERVKKLLGDRVKDVRMTTRLTSSPACIVADQHDMGMQMQRILKAAGQSMPESKPIFELNPEHAIIKRLDAETQEQRFADWTQLLLDQAILADGGQLEDPALFVQRLNQLFLEVGLST